MFDVVQRSVSDRVIHSSDIRTVTVTNCSNNHWDVKVLFQMFTGGAVIVNNKVIRSLFLVMLGVNCSPTPADPVVKETEEENKERVNIVAPIGGKKKPIYPIVKEPKGVHAKRLPSTEKRPGEKLRHRDF